MIRKFSVVKPPPTVALLTGCANYVKNSQYLNPTFVVI